MRLCLILCLLCPAPGLAWDFTPGLPCRLSHQTGATTVELTYDPTAPLYSITITTPQPLPDAPIFGMRFTGPGGLTISTNRHTRSDDGRSVTVMDSGFGNVLDGLQFNSTATALLGELEVSIPLDGAAEPVAAFRECRVLPAV